MAGRRRRCCGRRPVGEQRPQVDPAVAAVAAAVAAAAAVVVDAAAASAAAGSAAAPGRKGFVFDGDRLAGTLEF